MMVFLAQPILATMGLKKLEHNVRLSDEASLYDVE